MTKKAWITHPSPAKVVCTCIQQCSNTQTVCHPPRELLIETVLRILIKCAAVLISHQCLIKKHPLRITLDQILVLYVYTLPCTEHAQTFIYLRHKREQSTKRK